MTVVLEPDIYAPRRDIVSRLRRRSARVLACDTIRPRLERGLVSFTFDDCPVSVRDTALPMLAAKGWRGTLYAALGLEGLDNHLGPHMGAADYKAAHDAGHEIGDHTYSHLDPMRAGVGLTLADVNRNRIALEEAGIPAPTTFAYPYGEVTPALKRALRERFALLRGIHSPQDATLDLSLAASQRLYSAHMDDVMKALRIAAEQNYWLILFTHDVREDCSEFGCTPGEFGQVVDAVAELGLDVVPVADALERVQ